LAGALTAMTGDLAEGVASFRSKGSRNSRESKLGLRDAALSRDPRRLH